VFLSLVVVRQALAHFRRGHPDNRILGCVVAGLTAKDLVPDDPLRQRLAGNQRVVDGVAEERRESPAVAERGIREDTPELFANGILFGFGIRRHGRRLKVLCAARLHGLG
jgi:hypothetical protein